MSHVILPSHMVHVQESAEEAQVEQATPQAWGELNNALHSLLLYLEVCRNHVKYHK